MKDIYIALSGATAAWDNLSTIANNVANAKTQGFREARSSFELAGPPGMGAQYAATGRTTWSNDDGELETDGNPHHLALRGEGFFALEDGTFTRDGTFRTNDEGTLCAADGTPVLGESGPITLQAGESMIVGADGTVTGSKSGELGKIAIVSLGGGQPIGGNRWSGLAGDPPEHTSVVQGAVEGSNVDTMRGMIDMMEATRFFEAQQKAIQASDDMRSRLNQIGGG